MIDENHKAYPKLLYFRRRFALRNPFVVDDLRHQGTKHSVWGLVSALLYNSVRCVFQKNGEDLFFKISNVFLNKLLWLYIIRYTLNNNVSN